MELVGTCISILPLLYNQLATLRFLYSGTTMRTRKGENKSFLIYFRKKMMLYTYLHVKDNK